MSWKNARNDLRCTPGAEGHVESWFLRANAPDRPLAIWLKATIFAPRPDCAVAELWCVCFDGAGRRTWGAKRTVPFGLASFGAEPGVVEVGGGRFELRDGGAVVGELEGEGGRCRWDLRVSVAPGLLGTSMTPFPLEAMLEAPFPRSKSETPFPLLLLDGTVEVFGETVEVRRWPGMQGHNWGASHAFEYAWGQCHFLDGDGQVHCSAEGFSARLRLLGRTTPLISSLVVRRGEREMRFDRLVDLWRQEVSVGDLSWRLHLSGRDGEAVLEMEAEPALVACLGYHNPDGRLSFCLNSKLARTRLTVNPVADDGFCCASEHGGALELLRNQPDDRFGRVI